ncbi:MAG: hypothetical protein P8Y70_00305 [Candidatus Lokiarchaeota archaeon]
MEIKFFDIITEYVKEIRKAIDGFQWLHVFDENERQELCCGIEPQNDIEIWCDPDSDYATVDLVTPSGLKQSIWKGEIKARKKIKELVEKYHIRFSSPGYEYTGKSNGCLHFRSNGEPVNKLVADSSITEKELQYIRKNEQEVRDYILSLHPVFLPLHD